MKDNVFLNRNFRLVFFGALVSELGATLYSFAVSFYILEISGNNAFLQGLYLAICGVTQLIFTPVGGVLGDRFNRARIMSNCDYIKGSVIVLTTVLMLVFPSSAAHLVLLFILGAIGNAVSGIFNPAAGALLPTIVADDRLQQANAYFSVKNGLVGIVGIALAGILYSLLPIAPLFFIVGACFIFSAISEMFIRYDFVAKEEKLTVRLALSDLGEGFVYLKQKEALMALIISILFINFFLSPISGNFIPYFVKVDIASAEHFLFDRVLTPEMWNSVLQVFFCISSLTGSVIMSAKPQENKCGRKVAVRTIALALIMIGLTGSYWLLVDKGLSLNAFLVSLCAGFVLTGILLASVNISLNTSIMRMVDKDKLSKVSSLLSIMSQGLIPIASVIAGAILQFLGSTVLLSFSSAGFLCAALLLFFNKKVREI